MQQNVTCVIYYIFIYQTYIILLLQQYMRQRQIYMPETSTRRNMLGKSNIKSVIKYSVIALRKNKPTSNIIGNPEVQRTFDAINISNGLKLCTICGERYQQGQLINITQCEHKFCIECAQSFLVYRINTFTQIICADEQCTAVFSDQSEIFSRLPQRQKNKYKQRLTFLKVSQHKKNLKICIVQGCSGYIDITQQEHICNQCKAKFCKNCNLKWHEGDCLPVQQQHFEQVMDRYMKCERCLCIIEKTEGCQHMVCRCGHQFCYNCGQDWKGHICKKPIKNRQDKTACGMIVSICYKILLLFWMPFGFIFWILFVILISLALLLQSIILGPFLFYYETLTKSDRSKTECLLMIGIITGMIYGQYYFFMKYRDKIKEIIIKMYDKYAHITTLLCHK